MNLDGRENMILVEVVRVGTMPEFQKVNNMGIFIDKQS
jgi:hypothetical protein